MNITIDVSKSAKNVLDDFDREDAVLDWFCALTLWTEHIIPSPKPEYAQNYFDNILGSECGNCSAKEHCVLCRYNE